MPRSIEGDKTRDETLEEAAQIIEQSTSWGLSPTKLEAVQSFQRFAAKAIRAQKSDSAERQRMADIANSLTQPQRSTILGLGENFCVLGCSEPYAIRLTESNTRRPALVAEGPRDPQGYRTFALNNTGKAVRAAMTETV